MPMSFPTIESLRSAAELHKFREPLEGETVGEYRHHLANHAQYTDPIEAMEIRTGKGWDAFTDEENLEMLARTASINHDKDRMKMEGDLA